ncbi:nucleoside phosphatase [Dongshaea marina]|uniref:nucleoside phosphatase n=1 Tax=Dongshaea marina TaxID=2047966 RepID=UPI000D3E1FE3|nr:nucleoside phosphatase [Dongshaea marina]
MFLKSGYILLLSILISTSAMAQSNCQIIYDAGSSGTRLYIYQQQGKSWLAHSGPKVAALADPVRELRGKNWQDADAVVDAVVGALDAIRQPGPLNSKGDPRWSAFDWQKLCRVTSVEVLATAGMRIAEQRHRERSRELWQKLNQGLQAKLGKDVPIQTRTLSGFEEGLYAWIAVRRSQPSNRFGIVEMGGASSQVAFPCPECKQAKTVEIRGKSVKFYSYSYLGLGQDEAPKTLGFPKMCAYGVGLEHRDWQPANCRSRIRIRTPQGMFDPYNLGEKGYGTYHSTPIAKADVERWILTGAFEYMKSSDIQQCCEQRGKCYQPQTACYRANYLPEFLQSLGVRSKEIARASWTLGAAICNATDCLRNSGKLLCRWSKKGCLNQPLR